VTEPPAAPRPGPQRGLVAFAAALVVADLALATVLPPLLPRYVHLAGLSPAGAGILMGAYPMGGAAAAVPGGLAAARLGSRAAVLIGLAAAAGSGLALGWGSSAAVLVGARFVQGAAGSFTWAGGLAWLASATPAARRGEVLGTAMGFAAAGAVAGPAAGALAVWAGPGPAFTAAAGVSAVLMAAACVLPCPPGEGPRVALPARRVLRDRGLAAGLALTALGGMTSGAIDVLAPLRLDRLGAAPAVVAGTWIAAGTAEVALSPWAGRLADRRGAAAAGRVLLAWAAAAVLAVPLAGRAGWLAVLLAAGVPACGSLCVPGAALLSTGADRLGLHQGTAAGLGNLAWSAGQAGSAMAAGAAAQAASGLAPAGALAGLCLLALAALRPRARPSGPAAGVAGAARRGGGS
jgi:predicted MFS family arabinose efflux permease